MNVASWIILGIVVVVAILACRSAFGKARGSSCCTSNKNTCDSINKDCLQNDILGCSGSCASCSACKGSATSRNALVPIVREQG